MTVCVSMEEMRRLVTDTRIDAAMSCAPADTRAFLRGEIVKRCGSAVRSIGWDGGAFKQKDEDLAFDVNTGGEEKGREEGRRRGKEG